MLSEGPGTIGWAGEPSRIRLKPSPGEDDCTICFAIALARSKLVPSSCWRPMLKEPSITTMRCVRPVFAATGPTPPGKSRFHPGHDADHRQNEQEYDQHSNGQQQPLFQANAADGALLGGEQEAHGRPR